jgi:hypothetical protein
MENIFFKKIKIIPVHIPVSVSLTTEGMESVPVRASPCRSDMPQKIARCPYCFKQLPSQNAVRLHVAATLACNESWNKQFSQQTREPSQQLPYETQNKDSSSSSSSPWIIPNSPSDDEMETIADNFNLPNPPTAPDAIDEDVDELPSGPNILEIEVQGRRFFEQYPRPIGNPVGLQKTRFEKLHDEEKKTGKLPWDPFLSEDEWDLARWLINNVNQKATDKYLKLPMVSYIPCNGMKPLTLHTGSKKQ